MKKYLQNQTSSTRDAQKRGGQFLIKALFFNFTLLVLVASFLFFSGRFPFEIIIITGIVVFIFGSLILFSIHKMWSKIMKNESLDVENKQKVLNLKNRWMEYYFKGRMSLLLGIILILFAVLRVPRSFLFFGAGAIYLGGIFVYNAYYDTDFFRYALAGPMIRILFFFPRGEKLYHFIRKIHIALGIMLFLLGVFAIMLELFYKQSVK